MENEQKEKLESFPLRTYPSLIENLRLIMGRFGYSSVTPFIRMILIRFYNENKDKNAIK